MPNPNPNPNSNPNPNPNPNSNPNPNPDPDQVDSHAPSRSLYLTSNADGRVNRQLYVASLDAPAAWQPLSSGGAPVLAQP